MRNSTEIQRVIYRHDWHCVGEWASALDDLADLTDDEIDGLARGDQQGETSPGALQALLQTIGARLRSGASGSLALLIPNGRH